MFKLFSTILLCITLLCAAPLTTASANVLDWFSSSRPSTFMAASKTYEQPRESVFGKVIYISDGDTIHVQPRYGNKIKVRLYGIDAPEKAQPYGPQSTGILRNLIGNQYVNVQIYTTDRYGRSVGKIFLQKQDINAEMLKLGAAWHYKYYDKSADYQKYDHLEQVARDHHRGLWNRPKPTPPWEYRKAMRARGNR